MFWPCETRTSTCRSFATISSGLYRFLVIAVLLDVKDIPQVGPLQWGRISTLLVVRTHRMAATATLAEAATRFAKRSAKRLGSGAVSQMFRPATENGPGSTPTRTWLARASINRAR